MENILNHGYILGTILLTVYSQIIMRWQVSLFGKLPQDLSGKVQFVFNLLQNPWVISGVMATFLAGVSWMLAMTKFEVSYAYPYIGLNYVLILFASFLIFNEQLSLAKLVGTLVVVLGIVIIARG